MPVIALTQEMGSLSKDVALRLAETANLQVMRHEVVDNIAGRMKVDTSLINRLRGGKAGLRERFYATCAPEDADRAMGLLRRQSETPFVERTPLRAWPSAPSSYVVCAEDRAVVPAWSRRAARERLGIEPVELAGSDHSPFLGRPGELAELLVALANGSGT